MATWQRQRRTTPDCTNYPPNPSLVGNSFLFFLGSLDDIFVTELVAGRPDRTCGVSWSVQIVDLCWCSRRADEVLLKEGVLQIEETAGVQSAMSWDPERGTAQLNIHESKINPQIRPRVLIFKDHRVSIKRPHSSLLFKKIPSKPLSNQTRSSWSWHFSFSHGGRQLGTRQAPRALPRAERPAGSRGPWREPCLGRPLGGSWIGTLL